MTSRTSTIIGKAVSKGIDTKTLAKKTGIPLSTLYRRLLNPGRFTLDELQAIDRVLRFSETEFLELVRG
jgi:predicted transcriptional regulator